MAVVVRKAERRDAAQVAEFALRLFRQHHDYDPKRFADLGNIEGAMLFYGDRSESKEARVLVAEIDNKIVGFAYAEFEPVNYSDLLTAAMWIHDLYVDESARGAGAGRALVDAAISEAGNVGADKVVIHVAAKNETAQQFFAGKAFRTTMLEMTLNVD